MRFYRRDVLALKTAHIWYVIWPHMGCFFLGENLKTSIFKKNDIRRDVKSEKMISLGACTTKGTGKLATYGMSKMKTNKV